MLGGTGNVHGGGVSCNHTWSRYRKASSKDGSENVFIEDDEPATVEQTARCTSSDGRVCVSEQGSFADVLSAVAQGKAFVWAQPPFFDFWYKGSSPGSPQKNAQNDLGAGLEALRAELGLEWPPCSTVKMETSDSVATVGNRAISDVKDRLHASSFFTLHLRRSDAAKECNTDLEHVRAYAVKTIVPAMTAHVEKAPLLFFTDETDEEYIHAVVDLFSSLGVQAEYGDAIIRKVGEDPEQQKTPLSGDNMFNWMSAQFVMGKSVKTFRMDRGSCGQGGRTD